MMQVIIPRQYYIQLHGPPTFVPLVLFHGEDKSDVEW